MTDLGGYDGSIAVVLEEIRQTSALEGAAVLDLQHDSPTAPVTCSVGVGGRSTIAVGHNLLLEHPEGPAHTLGPDRRPIIVCPWVLPPSRPGGLVLWRGPRGRRWADIDHGLVASLAAVLRVSLTTEIGQVGLDRLTNLPNRRWFIEETDRHIDRLDRDAQIGTLLLVDIDDLHRLNARLGHDAGNRIISRLASRIRSMIRPADTVARIGGDEFAVWLTGMDHMTAAERADALCVGRLFEDLPDASGVTLSIGIASRSPGSGEDVRTLLRRAHMAAREVKFQGGGSWRVSRTAFISGASDPSV